jgi:hypothetical protein
MPLPSIGAAAWGIAYQSMGLALSYGVSHFAHKKINDEQSRKTLKATILFSTINGALQLSGLGITATAAKIVASVYASGQYALSSVEKVCVTPPQDKALRQKCQFALLSGAAAGIIVGVGASMLASPFAIAGLAVEALVAHEVAAYMLKANFNSD